MGGEKKMEEFRSKINDPNISFEEKLNLQKLFRRNIKRNSSKTRLRNRCKISGRENGNIRKFGLSRIMIRKFLGKGLLPGVVMASW